MRRLLMLLLVTLAAAGCGEDADPVERDRFTGAEAGSPAEEPGDARNTGVTTLSELETLLQERAGLELQRTGGRELGPQAGVPFLAHTRYEEAIAGLEFDVWVLGDVQAARRARANLSDAEIIEEGGRLARACNVVALYSPKTVASPVAKRVTRVLGELDC